MASSASSSVQDLFASARNRSSRLQPPRLTQEMLEEKRREAALAAMAAAQAAEDRLKAAAELERKRRVERQCAKRKRKERERRRNVMKDFLDRSAAAGNSVSPKRKQRKLRRIRSDATVATSPFQDRTAQSKLARQKLAQRKENLRRRKATAPPRVIPRSYEGDIAAKPADAGDPYRMLRCGIAKHARGARITKRSKEMDIHAFM